MNSTIGRLILSAGVAAGLSLAAGTAMARDLTVVGWGGAAQAEQNKAMFQPYVKDTGNPLVQDSWNGGIGVLRTKAQGDSTWDVVQVEADELVLGCEEGLYARLDWAKLGNKDQYLPGMADECGVGTFVWSTALAYDKSKLGEDGPKSWADFFDTKKFPGKRSLRRGPRQSLEFALMADGVAPGDIYKLLATKEGVDRAFKKLDTIKKDIVWWEAGSQPVQLLQSGEVVMTSVYNGRVFAANNTEKTNFALAWPAGFIYQVDSWVILANSPNKDQAEGFLKFIQTPARQQDVANVLAYGPTLKDSTGQIAPNVLPYLPTAPGVIEHGVSFDTSFWVDNIEALNERFNAWAVN
ncbi:ABC transporter substrate-binding protein [Ancylobacter dichloromethanicus]|uniref:ABC transporter substrate-binding protein n=1 Tax=Ancylobacter dichloromethanicus TaxID=518825 RepID=A0A9W6MZJ4_9HYPH|nr:ABC transporter substrate-binding protein [Ancylobacter dichloromethanicus]MBS7552797.1 ABC transporter substrate-binding protein [Ancylobacter dichloromethanicus]GLK72161.1 ABC transporter substrate-binding protein [Ancylobacter dichloromethanicus]